MAQAQVQKRPRVCILMGSRSDLEVMQAAAEVLADFGVEHEVTIASAHRSPAWTARYLRDAEERGAAVFVAGAGGAAHLAGMVAAHTTRPVIGVPIDSSALKGLDALLSTAMMPGGVAVATMSIGKAGAKNAGILAVQILALSDGALMKKLHDYKERLESEVEAAAAELQRSRRG